MRRDYPDTFYYAETQSGESFTDQPTGLLNINQLVQGEPHWVTQGTKDKKPKKLIFADWSARNWHLANKEKIKHEIGQLIHDGFKIYYRQKSGLIKSITNELTLSEYVDNDVLRSPIDPEEITKAAITQHRLSLQEILVLDYYLHPVLNETHASPDMPYLLMSDFLSLNDKEQEKLIEMTKRSNPSLKTIFYTTFPFKDTPSLKKLETHFPKATVAPRYQEITLSSVQLTLLLNTGSLFLEGITLKLDQLKGVTTLKLTGSDITWNQLKKLLDATPKLQKLELPEQSNLLGIELFAAPELNEIILPNSNIRPKDLSILIKSATNLKVLRLNKCQNVLKAFAKANSSTLKTLGLIHCNINDNDLQLLTNAMPNLERLTMRSYLIKNGTIHKFEKELNKFIQLILTSSNINLTNLSTLLNATPNIESIWLFFDHSLNGHFEVSKPLNALSKIALVRCSIYPKELINLMKAAPNLGQLDLQSCTNLHEALNPLTIQFEKLEEINFNRSTITDANLKTIIQATPHLKKLKLIGCKLRDIVETTKNLKELEELNLNLQEVTFNIVLQLIKNLPKLRLLGFPGPSPLSAEQIGIIRQLTPNLIIINTQEAEKPEEQTEELPDVPIVVPHSVEAFKDLKPTSQEDFVFKFKRINKTKNQNMIIEKFCQYCTLKQVHLDCIPKIQDGICTALSHFIWVLEQTKPDSAAQLITKIAQWDGTKNTMTVELELHFEALSNFITEDLRHNFRRTKLNYLGDGDNLISFLKTIPQNGYILRNSWHTIFIKKNLEDGSWLFYDPNFSNGPRKVNEQEMLQLIKQGLGSQIMVESNQANWVPVIQNPQKFIAEGGLLILNKAGNREAILNQLAKVSEYTTDALEGLLLRNTSGTPVWIPCLEVPVLRPLIYSLLIQFIQKNPKTYFETLQKSIELLTPVQKEECITQLLSSSTDKELTETLITVLRNAPNLLHYEKQLQTWDTPSKEAPSLLEYCQRCMQPDGAKKRLIKLSSSAQIDSLHWALEDYAKKTKRPVFYVNSPRDLICSAPYIQRDKTNPESGTLQKGPGGRLFDFLQAHQTGEPPIIIVNYEGFSDEDLVHFNPLLDKESRADGTKVPEQALIVGLINTNKPDCYKGSDFYSRFDQTEICPITEQDLAKALPPLPLHPMSIDKSVETTPINLFHASNWKNLLLGRWILNGDKLSFKEGLLVSALKKGLPLEIQNGFWDNHEFQNFWRSALQNGVIEHAGRTIEIPPNLQLFHSEGYPWKTLKSLFTLTAHPTPRHTETLNPQLINTFFSHDTYQKEKGLTHTQGLIEAAKNNTLKVLLTHPLTHDQWARILIECKDQDVDLEVKCAPGVTLPQELHSSYTAEIPKISPWNISEFLADTTLLTSSDVDTTLALLTKKNPKNWQIIDVSECHASDLLEHLNSSFNTQSLKFEFSQTLGVLRKAIEDKTPIILKGHFSAELKQQLAPLLIERQNKTSLSPLVLISDTPKSFQFLSSHTHQVTVTEKAHCLDLTEDSVLHKQLQPFLANESLSRLKARRDAYQPNPWKGLLEAPAVSVLKELNTATSKEEAEAFHQQRMTAVSQVLKKRPYIFLAGLSGVGKSTFVTQFLGLSPNTLCTLDQDCPKQKRNAILKQWARTKNPAGLHLLFVDEATLSASDWSMFEGLYNIPPGILVDGEWLPLTENHKVVFAGNPVSYGDERRLASLFERHGNSLFFEPLPTAVLYEQLLKPAFAKTKLESSTEALSQHFIEVYRFLVACSTTDVLIAPRELQMMMLLTLSHCQSHPKAKPEDVAHHYAYLLAKNLVPENKKAEFDQQFKPKNNWDSPITLNQADFILTPSRQPIAQQLDDLLTLRQMRRSATNPIHQYGGLGGLIIDGDPGVGKSELVLALLRHRGYEEVHQFDGPPNIKGPDKPFYRMPVSMQLDDKIKLLLKAFHEGAVVMVDEINASPMMERLMNSLLMGYAPDGKRPQKPGFLIIGTQNPITMAGRRAPSTALSRRLITSLLASYPDEEMKNILLHKAITEAQAKAMIAAYNKNVKYAQDNHLSPLPTFRKLLNLAENVIKAQEKPVPNTKSKFILVAKHWTEGTGAFSDKTSQPMSHRLLINSLLNSSSRTPENSAALPKFKDLLNKNPEYIEAYADIYLSNQKVKLDDIIKLHDLKDAKGKRKFQVGALANAMTLMAKKGWQSGNNYLALIEIGANTQANQYLQLQQNNERLLNEYLSKCNLVIAQIEKLAWGSADPIHDYCYEMKKLVADNKADFFILGFQLQVLQHYKNAIDTPDNQERRRFARYIDEIKKQSLSKTDTYTEIFCQQMQDILDKEDQEFKDYLPQLTKVQEAVCSPQMKAVNEELQRLETDSHAFFTKGGQGKKIKVIKQAVGQVPLLEREHIFTNQNNPLCNEVRKSLALCRVSLINPIGDDGNVISKKAATSFKNIEQKFPTIDEVGTEPVKNCTIILNASR